jgi:glycosyltransferase involved in cell wall biosynthesis
MRILMVAPDVPFPPVGGGQLRLYHLLRALAGRHDLTLAAFTWGAPFAAPPFPVEVLAVPGEVPPLHREMYGEDEQSARRAWERLAGETDEPFFVSYYQSPAMEAVLARAARDGFDLILIENTFMARYLPVLPAATPKVLDLHNVHALMARRQAGQAPPGAPEWREAIRTACFESKAASQCTLCVTVSDAEAGAARELLGVRRVSVVPNGVDPRYFAPTEEAAPGDALLFTGSMNYQPNIDGVRFFVTEVLPLIRKDLPDVRLDIVGTSPGDEVRRLAGAGVRVHGAVPDVRPWYRQAAVVVVPLLHGGGTRLKILEAAACGKAVVATSIGAEGLNFQPGRDLVIADRPVEFAEGVTVLCRDTAARRRYGRAARQASLGYDWDVIGDGFNALVEQCVRG